MALLEKCASIKHLQQIHAQMLINSVNKLNFLLSKLIDCKDFTYASLLFSSMHDPDDHAFNIMIRGLTTTWHQFDMALGLYYQMKLSGTRPNNFTYPSLFISCANLLALDHGRLAHSMIFKCGLNVDSHVSHSLITMYARCGQVGYARKVFDEISDRDVVSWNSMISGYEKMGFPQEAMELFWKMKELGFKPDETTLVSILGACRDLGDLRQGRLIEDFVMENSMELSSFIVSALVDMYGKCGDLSSARRIFDKMPKKDVITWNAMITGYAQNGFSDEAIMLFNGMREAGLFPTKVTLVVVLSACASIGALDIGKQIDQYASERGMRHDIYVDSALIDMYAKCGSLGLALRVFEDMPRKNIVSWNAMISALAFHGCAMEALSLFKKLLKDGGTSHPNHITFIGVLSACVHAGLVDEGKRLFDLMKSLFGLAPKIEHYSCMVDLLARAGLVREAWSFIEKMPEKPDGILLGALLGACRKVKNVEISEQVIQLLLEIEPLNSGNYVISSEIYANMKRWNDSARMRVLMKHKGVSKTPGCSWLEIENQLHEFHAGDGVNIVSDELYLLFAFLNWEMRMEGYTPIVDHI